MDWKELKARCKDRVFDQITVVTDDIFQELANLKRILHVIPGDICTQTDRDQPGLTVQGETIAYTQRCATAFYQNTSLCIIQPVEGNTVYQQYLNRFGGGLCCVRERIPSQAWEATLEQFSVKGLNIAQRMTSAVCEAAWIDMTDTLGILYEVITDESEQITPAHVVPGRIAQINITTPDVRKTIETLTELLEIGPWEVGCQSKRTATDSAFRVDGRLEDVEFEFLLAILVCGNIEWEAIQPVKGPLVYFDFLEKHGIGYHHILQEIAQDQWEDTLGAYAEAGVELSCRGKLGPVTWCYMDTEDELGFFMELRTDAVMTKLPDGYVQYFYPEEGNA